MLTRVLAFRRVALLLAILAIGLLGSSAAVDAHKGEHLAAPVALTCDRQEDGDDQPGGTILYTDWTDTDADGNEIDADKWSVDLEVGYDTDGDNEVDRTEEFSFGTSDRVDGRPMAESDLDIPFEELFILIDTDGDGTPDEEVAPSEGTMKVKGLNPPQGPQDNTFSETISCSL